MKFSEYIIKIENCTDYEQAMEFYFQAEEDKDITDAEFVAIYNAIERIKT